VRGDKYQLTEDRTEGTVHSMLTVIGVDSGDDFNSFICSAENRAGIKSKNFTLYVTPASTFGAITANWSKVELAGSIVAMLVLLILVFIIVTVVMARSRRFTDTLSNAKKLSNQQNEHGGNGDVDKKPPPHVGQNLAVLLKNGTGNNLVYPTGTEYRYMMPQHLSMLGLDAIDKKPEIFLPAGHNQQVYSNNNNNNNTPVPDLVSAGQLLPSGYELNTYSSNGKRSQPHFLPLLILNSALRSFIPSTTTAAAIAVQSRPSKFGHLNDAVNWWRIV